jgi:LmbE family N-acetylglucosaminyl deacetylase
MNTVLAIGAHIGDAELTSGPFLAEAVQRGHQAVILALTPGERGNPRLSITDYKQQKLAELQDFSASIGAEPIVFDDLADGSLSNDFATASRVAAVIKKLRPSIVTGHWSGSWHPDHVAAALLTERAVFLAALPTEDEHPAFEVPCLAHAENCEDDDGFKANTFVEISEKSFEIWSCAIQGYTFARGETTGFRYIDYYSSLLTVRGCLAQVQRASAFMVRDSTPRILPL